MSDPITAQEFMAGLSCNSGTRDVPAPASEAEELLSIEHYWEAQDALRNPKATATEKAQAKTFIDAFEASHPTAKAGVPAPPPVEGETGHTPGPWAKDYGGTVGHIKAIGYRPDGKTPTVARYDMAAESVPQSEREANAALIARAPEMAAENATLREQLADADRTLAGFVRAVREARETLVAVRSDSEFLARLVLNAAAEGSRLNGELVLSAAECIQGRCDGWLTPAIAALPPARVVTREEGQS